MEHTATYTPKWFAKRMADELFRGLTSEEIARVRILDPACGDGTLLAACADWLRPYVAESDTLGSHLLGIDIDESAIARCRSSLPVGTHLERADFILDKIPAVDSGALTAIISNPPWVMMKAKTKSDKDKGYYDSVLLKLRTEYEWDQACGC